MVSITSGRRGLYLPFEESCLRDALRQHVHHSDHRAGMQRHRPITPPVAKPTKNNADKSLSPAAARLDVPERQSQRTPREGYGAAELVLKGTMDVKVPFCSSAPVRCRISRCIETTAVTNEEDIVSWFRNNCNWQRTATLAIGKQPGRINRRLLGERSAATKSPCGWGTPSSGSRLTTATSAAANPPLEAGVRSNRCQPGGPRESADSQWSFLRHMPQGHQVKDPAESEVPNAPLQRTRRGSLSKQQVLVSDITALLTTRQTGNVEVVQIVQEVPPATAERWWRMLQPKRRREAHAPEAVARHIVKVLVERPDVFCVSEADPIERSQITLDPSYCPEVVAAADGQTPVMNSLNEKRWISMLPLLGRLKELEEAVQIFADFPVDIRGVEVVAQAVERAESFRLCGGLVFARDQLQCRWNQGGLGQASALRTSPESKTVPGEWTGRCLANVPDEDGLEAGDSVRLLARVAAGLCYDDPGSALKKETFAVLCREHRLQIDDEPNGVECLFEDVMAGFRHLGVDEVAMSCFGSLLLELLLQGIFHRTSGMQSAAKKRNPKELLGCLLWHHCGWDSPIGRRSLRKLFRAYDAYTSGGQMSSDEFFRFGHDAGLTTRRDIVDRHKRFSTAFRELMGDVEKLQFNDFLALLQTFADAAKTPTWLALEGCISSVGGSAASNVQKALSVKSTGTPSSRRGRSGILHRTNTEITPMSSKMDSTILNEHTEQGTNGGRASKGGGHYTENVDSKYDEGGEEKDEDNEVLCSGDAVESNGFQVLDESDQGHVDSIEKGSEKCSEGVAVGPLPHTSARASLQSDGALAGPPVGARTSAEPGGDSEFGRDSRSEGSLGESPGSRPDLLGEFS